MIFTEPVFAPFFILVFLLFYSFRRRPHSQMVLLLCASCVFYGWWNAKYLILIFIPTFLDFYLGKLMYRAESRWKRNFYLAVSLVINLGLLAFFKYGNFFIESTNAVLAHVGTQLPIAHLDVLLPLGISFYTFETLSYTLDIYFGHLVPTNSLLRFMVFLMAFPRMVAGPIVRAKDILAQLDSGQFGKSRYEGVFLIFYGLVKKVLLADILGHYFVDPIFANPASGGFSSLELLLGLYGYAFQIFFDFSGYSDIAIGLGKLFGLEFPINFRSPYVAENPSEFWKRWHISLSTWLRDYLYIPLGGNRCSRRRNIINLVLVMLLGGLWHGANWTFVVWGALHGFYLVVYRYADEVLPFRISVPRLVRQIIFFHLVCLAWIFFRSPNFSLAYDYLHALSLGTWTIANFVHWQLFGILTVSAIVHYLVEPKLPALSKKGARLHWFIWALAFFCLTLSFSVLSEQGITQKAFIYFQF